MALTRAELNLRLTLVGAALAAAMLSGCGERPAEVADPAFLDPVSGTVRLIDTTDLEDRIVIEDDVGIVVRDVADMDDDGDLIEEQSAAPWAELTGRRIESRLSGAIEPAIAGDGLGIGSDSRRGLVDDRQFSVP